MADNLTAVFAFALALASPLLVWSITRPRPDTRRGNVGLFAEVFVTVTAAAILTQHAAIPALQWPRCGGADSGEVQRDKSIHGMGSSASNHPYWASREILGELTPRLA